MLLKNRRFLMIVLSAIFIHTLTAMDNQGFTYSESNYNAYSTDNDKLLESFYQPINFTKTGFRDFLQNAFNNPIYSKEFLPHNLDKPVNQFLMWSKQSHQSAASTSASLRLFTNKLKAAPYMTAGPILAITAEMPGYLKDSMIEQPTTMFAKLKKLVKRLLFTAFNAHFDYFKAEPNNFLDTLATDIVKEVKESEFMQAELDKEQLRTTVVHFLDTGLSKIIWSPLDQTDAWDSFRKISEHLNSLKEHEIIIEDDLDDLLNTLVERFIHFLELAGSDLLMDTVITIEKDVALDDCIVCHVCEQEDDLITKKQRLLDALSTTRAKIAARSQGIITEVIALQK
ncbi:MAG TPA: hypothetical protein VHO47_04840 [Candidatus Babeliales bacterium]|nr:hypothetical protein [Candidatus Babeliales bacterium]